MMKRIRTPVPVLQLHAHRVVLGKPHGVNDGHRALEYVQALPHDLEGQRDAGLHVLLRVHPALYLGHSPVQHFLLALLTGSVARSLSGLNGQFPRLDFKITLTIAR